MDSICHGHSSGPRLLVALASLLLGAGGSSTEEELLARMPVTLEQALRATAPVPEPLD
jgi:hypothetical protein